jgi:hypothetical protein
MNKMYYQDIPKCYHEIWVKKKSDLRYVPACPMSNKFAKLLRKKILTAQHLSVIESMGYVVEIDKKIIGK